LNNFYLVGKYSEKIISSKRGKQQGKGERSKEVIDACKKYKSIYLITFGGCGAYLSKFIKKVELIAFEELGAEAIYKMEVKNFPAIVGIDIYGNYLYK